MTKGTIIESALLNILGGVLTQDANVKRVDIEAYLPTAVANALKQSMFADRAEDRADASYKGYSDRSPSPEFYKEIVLTPVRDETLCRYYVSMPALLDLPGNWNVLNARPATSFDIDYIRISTHQQLIGVKLDSVFYWLSNRNGLRAYFSALPEPVGDVVMTVAISPEALAMTDELPLPPSVEYVVINMLTQYFRQQRFNPADNVLDNNDINESSGRPAK